MSATLTNCADLGNNAAAVNATMLTKLKVSVRATSGGNTFEKVFSKEVSTKAEGCAPKDTAKDNQIITDDRGCTDTTQTQRTQDCSEDVQQLDATTDHEDTSDIATETTTVTKVSFKLSVTTVESGDAISVVDDLTLEELQDRLIDAMEAISSMLVSFAQILDVTVDELQGSFEQLDISFETMIDSDSLSNLMNQLGQCDDISQMLCNEQMLMCFDSLKEAVNKMLDEVGLVPQEFKELMSSQDFRGMLDEVMIQNPVELLKKLSQTINSQDEEAEPADDLPLEEVPEFTVTKQDETTETDNSEQSLDMRSDAKEVRETRTDDKSRITSGLEAFIKGLEKAFENSGKLSEIPEGQLNVRDMVFQIVDAIKVNLSPDNTSLELSLTPESLGKIHLNISTENGVVTARIETENETAKQAIEGQLEVLKESIVNQGIRVEAIEVTVTGFNFSDSKNAESKDSGEKQSVKSTGRKQLKDGAAAMETSQDSEAAGEAIPEGSTVNYVA